jgi:hypothetical protein
MVADFDESANENLVSEVAQSHLPRFLMQIVIGVGAAEQLSVFDGRERMFVSETVNCVSHPSSHY